VDLVELLVGAVALLAGSLALLTLLTLVTARFAVRRVALLTPAAPSPRPAVRLLVRPRSSDPVTDPHHHPRRPRAPGLA
jgi:hypothetical protein